MKKVDFKKGTRFLKAIANPKRLEIIYKLLDGEKCVTNLKELIKAPQPNISQHLTILKLNNIVDWKQDSKKKCYYLKNKNILKNILEVIEKV